MEEQKSESVDQKIAEVPLTRKQRRQHEKLQNDMQAKEKKRVAKSCVELTNNIHELIKAYTDGYNEFAQSNPDNKRRLKSMQMPWSLNEIQLPLNELMENTKGLNLGMFDGCMSKDQPGKVNVLYMRVDMNFTLHQDAEIRERPGVPEAITQDAEGIKVQQLFYHALHGIPQGADAFTHDVLRERLMADFMTHIFCMGFDMQNINNNNQWQSKLNHQTATIDEKVKEISDIFAHVGEQAEMKVANP